MKHVKQYLLTKDNTHYRLEVYDNKLANKLNKRFKLYDKGFYRFKVGEEAVFKLNDLRFIQYFIVEGNCI